MHHAINRLQQPLLTPALGRAQDKHKQRLPTTNLYMPAIALSLQEPTSQVWFGQKRRPANKLQFLTKYREMLSPNYALPWIQTLFSAANNGRFWPLVIISLFLPHSITTIEATSFGRLPYLVFPALLFFSILRTGDESLLVEFSVPSPFPVFPIWPLALFQPAQEHAMFHCF